MQGWTRKLLKETRLYPNVLIQTLNEFQIVSIICMMKNSYMYKKLSDTWLVYLNEKINKQKYTIFLR